jgi:hypothetical protein
MDKKQTIKLTDIKKLYKNVKGWNIEAKLKEYPDPFTVELFNPWHERVDCKIEHIGYNFYFRTSSAKHGKKYKNFKTLKTAIKHAAKKYKLTLEKLIITNPNGDILEIE